MKANDNKEYVKTGDPVTIEGVEITFKANETVKEFAERINKTIGREVAGYITDLNTITIN